MGRAEEATKFFVLKFLKELNKIHVRMRYLIFLFVLISLSGFCREIPVLEPNDPAFSWMDELIERDFRRVRGAISQAEYAQDCIQRKSNGWLTRFRVVDNVPVEGAAGACYNMLEYLCENYGLPDLDFYYWNQDGPWESQQGYSPVLVGCRNIGAHNTILFTDWLFDIKNPSGPWNDEQRIIDDTLPFLKWEERENIVFWRGAATDVWSGGLYNVNNWHQHARGKAVFLSSLFPDYIDAAFTAFHHFLCDGGVEEAKKMASLVPTSSVIPIAEHLPFKYQLQITGLMGNYPRDRWQFYSESVVFRHPCPHEMYWYPLLQEWSHYIPVKTSLDDLLEKILWTRDHDQECRAIAEAARQFALTHFMPEHIALYSYKVLLKYSKIQSFSP